MRRLLALLTISLAFSAPAVAQETPTDGPMTLDRIAEIVTALDPEAVTDGRRFQITVDDTPVLIVTDPAADRMRAIVHIRPLEGMTEDQLLRVMQANFDTALDARYAVANGVLWATFIHPLSPLEKDQLISGIGQTVNIAKTYGSLYTGGALQFGQGDSGALQRELIERLLDKGQDI